jgi:hypothetical protein
MLDSPLFRPDNRNLGTSITDFSQYGAQPAVNVSVGPAQDSPARLDAAPSPSIEGESPSAIPETRGLDPQALAAVPSVDGTGGGLSALHGTPSFAVPPAQEPMAVAAAAPIAAPQPTAIGSSAVFAPSPIPSGRDGPPSGDAPSVAPGISGNPPGQPTAQMASTPSQSYLSDIAAGIDHAGSALLAPVLGTTEIVTGTLGSAQHTLSGLTEGAVADTLTGTVEQAVALAPPVEQVTVGDVAADVATSVIAPSVGNVVPPVAGLATATVDNAVSDVGGNVAATVDAAAGAIPPAASVATDLVDMLTAGATSAPAAAADVATPAAAAMSAPPAASGVVGEVAAPAANVAIGAVGSTVAATPPPAVTEIFSGSDPGAGIQTLVGMVQAADTFDLSHVNGATTTVTAPGSIVDTLAADVDGGSALLGTDHAAEHAPDPLDLHQGLGGLG